MLKGKSGVRKSALLAFMLKSLPRYLCKLVSVRYPTEVQILAEIVTDIQHPAELKFLAEILNSHLV
jgi:hypothetical protein